MINYTVESVEKLKNDNKKPESVLDYLIKVWEGASEPQGECIPAGSVVIHRRIPNRHDYDVWTMRNDYTDWASFENIRIVSYPSKVGFYMQESGLAYYWDGSDWCFGKGGARCDYQDYGFSAYIGDVEGGE